MKHTPGPWTVHSGGQNEFVIKGNSWIIAETAKPHASMDSTEKANVYLMATSPEMLDLLIRISEFVKKGQPLHWDALISDSDEITAGEEVLAIIAKATKGKG